MKKFLLAAILLFALFWMGVLAFIPSPLTVSSVVYTHGQAAKVNALAMTAAGWSKWWPGSNNNYPYSYQIVSQTPLSAQLFAKGEADTFTSEITVLPLTPDSSAVLWKTQLAASINPFTRIQQYNRATHIRQNFQLLLDSLAAYLSDRKKMYGLDIAISNFKNPFMLSTQASFARYPSVDEVYNVIEKMRSYAQANGAAPVDSPMVNIEGMDNNYLLRTALPVNKKLAAQNDIGFKQMVLGKTLVGTVAGGRHIVEQSLLSMQNFISDYRLTSPAIPFQLWVINRQQQPDSSKWVTRLYYPIF